MEQDYTKLLSHLPSGSPSTNLTTKILGRVYLYEENRIKNQRSLWAGIGILSSLSTVWLSIYTYNHLIQSGFSQYASLIFSEKVTLITYAKDFSAVLLESLPIMATASLFFTLAVCMWSIKSYIDNRINTVSFA